MTFSRPLSPRSRLLAALAAITATVAAVGAGGQLNPVDASGTGKADRIEAPATVTKKAKRASQISGTTPNTNGLVFPMATEPVCRILSNFGEARSGGRSHQAIDILATLGQDVYAVADGIITDKVVVGGPNSSLSGNMLEVTVPDKTYYGYAHLSGFAPGIEKGTAVKQGQVIGYVGDTGNPGPGNYHLHFEVHPKGGAAIDPLKVLTPVPSACTVW